MELIKYAQQLAKKIATEKSGEVMNPVEQRLRASYSNKRGIVEVGQIIQKNFGWRGFYFGFKYHVGMNTNPTIYQRRSTNH
jgi:hypothetical protein